jgi:hypothetical protein
MVETRPRLFIDARCSAWLCGISTRTTEYEREIEYEYEFEFETTIGTIEGKTH